MATTVAQATNPGASNAADFQPPTQNPQTAPGQLFNQSQQLQSGDQSTLLENNKSSIQVPSNPAPADSQVVQPDVSNGLGLWLVVVLAAAVILAVMVWRHFSRPAPAAPTEEVPAEQPVALAAPEKPAAKQSKPTRPKTVPKKSKSKRKKRARR